MFTITTTDGRRHRALRDVYASRDEAAEALRNMLGWDEIHLSDDYTVDENSHGWSAYETQEDCEADSTGGYAPRVIETRPAPNGGFRH